MRTMTQIPGIHIKSRQVVHGSSPSAHLARHELEKGESLQGLLASHVQKPTRQKAKTKTLHCPLASTDVLWHRNADIHIQTHACTSTYPENTQVCLVRQ